MKALKWLDEHLEETLMIILLIIITLVSFVQVIIRNIPWIPSLKWAEELCRFCWIWSVFLSLPYTLRRCSMLRVTVLLDAMPQTLRKIFNIFVDLVNLAVMAFLFYYSIPVFTSRVTSAEFSPAMRWPMWIIYLSLIVGFGLAVIRGLQTLIDHIVHFKTDKLLSGVEQSIADAQDEISMAQDAEGIKAEGKEE